MRANQGVSTSEVWKLEQAYAGALEEYLSMGGEGALRNAYELGRTALADGWGLLDVAAMHHAAVAPLVLRIDRPALQITQELDRAHEFFRESLIPYEMALRGFQDATSALHRLNETLEQEIHRIAHAVHDEAGQLLFAARLAMSSVAHDIDPALQGRLQEVGTIPPAIR